MTRKVVITGLGATTPIGGDVPTMWQNALKGVSGARTLEDEWVAKYELPVHFAARCTTPALDVLSRVEAKRMDPSTQFGVIASREAWADSGITEIDHDRLAVAFATGIGGVWTLLDAWDTLKEKGPRRVLPMTVPMLMPNGVAAAVSLDLGARAGAHTPVSACASGTEALHLGLDLIRSGKADVVMCGGAEAAIHPMPLAAFSSMQALSRRNDDPERASRPYDLDRDGFVMGEGAGALVLEAEEHALARGARIYAELAGTGVTADAYHITAPDPEGLGATRALKAAMFDARVQPEDVVHINAHATSTPVGDKPEYTALKAALRQARRQRGRLGHQVPDRTPARCLRRGGIGDDRPGHATNARPRSPSTWKTRIRRSRSTSSLPRAPCPAGDIVALNNSFGFGGHNAVAVAIRSL
jgi:3-oxoacyl-[acyl-carrier-protein] synthase II